MTITKSFDGEKFAYSSDDPSCTLLLTGPVFGSVSAADGTAYNVSQDWVEVKHHHVGEVMHAIALKHEGNGNPYGRSQSDPDYDPFDDEFLHICNAHCGSLRRTAEEIEAAHNSRLSQVGHGHLVSSERHGDKLAWIRREVDMHTEHEAPVLSGTVTPAQEG